MNFQEAIELVLTSSPEAMTAAKIADAINERKLYLDWKGKPVNAGLVAGRAAQHPKLFSINNKGLSLVNDKSKERSLINEFKNISFNSGLAHSGIVLPFFLFWGRLTLSTSQMGSTLFGEYTFPNFLKINSETERVYFLQSTFAQLNKMMSFDTNISLNEKIINKDNIEAYGYFLESIYYSRITSENSSDMEFSNFFKIVIQDFSYDNIRGQGATNSFISTVIRKIIGRKDKKRLYDPFAGSAGLICDLEISKDSKIHLQEVNNEIAFLAFMNMILKGFNNFSIQVRDSLLNPSREKYDLVITEIPYGIRVKNTYPIAQYLSVEGSSKIESINVQLTLNQLNENGKAVITVPDSFLSSQANFSLRRHLIENDLIHMVVSLPSNSYFPYSSIKASILVIDFNKPFQKRKKVLFQDFNDRISDNPDVCNLSQDWDNIPANAAVIETGVIEKNQDYLLDKNFYIQSAEFKQGNYKAIGDLIINYKTGSTKNDSLAIDKKFAIENNFIPIVLIKDLSVLATEFSLNPENVEKRILSDEVVTPRHIISQECILVAKVGGKLKPTYFSGKVPIVISSNVLAIFPNKDLVLSEYLIFQLNKEYAIDQINTHRKGAAQKFLKISDFLTVSIKMDTIENQIIELNEYYKKELQRTEELVEKEVRKSDELEITILSSLEHELRGQILGPLVEEIGVLKSFFDRKQGNDPSSFNWDERVSGMPKSRRVKEVFAHFDEVIGTATKLFDNIQSIIKLDKSKLSKSRVNLQEFIKSCLDEFGDTLDNYHIGFSFDFNGKSNIKCDIDTNNFKNVISNFVRNSIEHGFTDLNPIRCIVFNISKSESSNEVILDMLDNGKGFSIDFEYSDYITFGTSSKGSGSGIGGYLLDRTVQVHDGRVEYIPKSVGLISIPSVNNYPFYEKKKLIPLNRIQIQPGVHLRIFLPIINQ